MPGPSIIGGGKPAIASAVVNVVDFILVLAKTIASTSSSRPRRRSATVGGRKDRAEKASQVVEANADNAISAQQQ